MLKLTLLALSGGTGGNGNGHENGDHEDFSHDDFLSMSLQDVERISGVARPFDRTSEAHKEFREKAWASYRKDIENRDEWGNARQGEEAMVDNPPAQDAVLDESPLDPD